MGKDRRFRPDTPKVKAAKPKKFTPHIFEDEPVYTIGQSVMDDEEFADLSTFYNKR